MKKMCRLFMAAWVAVLGACGGSGATDISSSALMFGKLASFTVTGKNLDKGITLTAPGCTGIAESAGSTDSQKVYTCTPSRVGGITVTAAGGGTTLRVITVFVPQPQLTISTRIGGVSQADMVVELYPGNAPLTVNNVLAYVNAGFYSDLIFHRVVPNYVVQGGGFKADLTQPTARTPVKLEMPNGLSNLRGTVAMARTALPDTATSQFFINTVDNMSLDTLNGGYAVFGKVVQGLETVDAIAAVPTQTQGGMADVPSVVVLITSVTQTQ